MGCETASCLSCGVMPCVCACGFTVLDGQALAKTLVSSLINPVDNARNIATCLGARPYQISLIWTRWSGGKRNAGTEELLRREMLLPTPLVDDLNNLNLTLQTIGTQEQGVLHVTEISARYTEDYLMGRDEDGRPIPEDQNFYYEVFFPRPNVDGIRRRFTPVAAPNLFATRLEWTINLTRAFEDRHRSGKVR